MSAIKVKRVQNLELHFEFTLDQQKREKYVVDEYPSHDARASILTLIMPPTVQGIGGSGRDCIYLYKGLG